MSLNFSRKEEGITVHAFTKKLADIPNGATVCTSDLTDNILREGSVIGRDANGLYHLLKTATVTASVASDATVIPVRKGHHFKVGDVVMAKTGAKAYAIASITTNADDTSVDNITVSTALGEALSNGDGLILAAKSGASASAFKFTPLAMVGESYDVKDARFDNNNLWVNAVTIGQVKTSLIPACPDVVKNALKGIIFI